MAIVVYYRHNKSVRKVTDDVIGPIRNVQSINKKSSHEKTAPENCVRMTPTAAPMGQSHAEQGKMHIPRKYDVNDMVATSYLFQLEKTSLYLFLVPQMSVVHKTLARVVTYIWHFTCLHLARHNLCRISG